MIDLLNLNGIVTVDCQNDDETIVIIAKTTQQLTTCTQCGGGLYKHGQRNHRYADTPLYMKPTTLQISVHRYRCKICKQVLSDRIDCVDENRRCTSRLIQYIQSRCFKLTFSELSRQTGLSINSIRHIAQDHLNSLEQSYLRPTPSILGIDEVMIAGEYRCVLTDLDRHTVFDILPTRKQPYLESYFNTLKDKDNIQIVCSDMWKPFENVCTKCLPNAALVLDRFHVVKLANEVVERIRKDYQKALDKKGRKQLKKHLRWLLCKRLDKLQSKDIKILQELANEHPKLVIAYFLKEKFFNIYEAEDKNLAILAFLDWMDSIDEQATGIHLPGFCKLKEIIKRHFVQIFNYWDSINKASNGYTECVNGLIKLANRLGRGYSFEMIRARALYGHKDSDKPKKGRQEKITDQED